jgi:hypothetical protein
MSTSRYARRSCEGRRRRDPTLRESDHGTDEHREKVLTMAVPSPTRKITPGGILFERLSSFIFIFVVSAAASLAR